MIRNSLQKYMYNSKTQKKGRKLVISVQICIHAMPYKCHSVHHEKYMQMQVVGGKMTNNENETCINLSILVYLSNFMSYYICVETTDNGNDSCLNRVNV